MKKTLLFSLLLITLFTACKKDKEATLQSKWTIENVVVKEYFNGSLTNTTTVPGGGSTIDFQSNGSVVITAPGSPTETYPYTMQPGSKVSFDGDTFDIRDLTHSSVILYIRDDYAAGEYDETFINLRK